MCLGLMCRGLVGIDGSLGGDGLMIMGGLKLAFSWCVGWGRPAVGVDDSRRGKCTVEMYDERSVRLVLGFAS